MTTGVLVGYARTSTAEQRAGLDAQLRDLKAAGCRKVFSEQVSSIGQRAQVDAALGYLREGDGWIGSRDQLAVSAILLMIWSARAWRCAS